MPQNERSKYAMSAGDGIQYCAQEVGHLCFVGSEEDIATRLRAPDSGDVDIKNSRIGSDSLSGLVLNPANRAIWISLEPEFR